MSSGRSQPEPRAGWSRGPRRPSPCTASHPPTLEPAMRAIPTESLRLMPPLRHRLRESCLSSRPSTCSIRWTSSGHFRRDKPFSCKSGHGEVRQGLPVAGAGGRTGPSGPQGAWPRSRPLPSASGTWWPHVPPCPHCRSAKASQNGFCWLGAGAHVLGHELAGHGAGRRPESAQPPAHLCVEAQVFCDRQVVKQHIVLRA